MKLLEFRWSVKSSEVPLAGVRTLHKDGKDCIFDWLMYVFAIIVIATRASCM